MDEILHSNLPDVDKLKAAFAYVTAAFLAQTARDLELARAMHDYERVVKEQIKMEVIKGTQGILQSCYTQILHVREMQNER